MLYALCSAKGAPGTTVFSLALTCALANMHEEGVALVEADPVGGDIAAFLGLSTDPGMVSLAAAARHQSAWPDITAHAQRLPAGGLALLGSTDPTQATSSITTLASRLRLALGSMAAAVVDCGRWQSNSPASPIVRDAAATIVCLRPTVASIESVRVRAQQLWEASQGPLGLAVMGDGPYSADEVQAATGLPVLVTVPQDRRGIGVLCGGSSRPGTAARLPIVRAARTVIDRLHEPGRHPVASNGILT